MAGNTEVYFSQLTDRLEGWNGHTVFKLLNGQKWEQADNTINHSHAFRPRVTIYDQGGQTYLQFEGNIPPVAVKRASAKAK